MSYTPVFENSYSIRRPLYCATYVSISELSAGNVYDCGHPSYILCNTKTLQTKLFGKRFVSLTHSLYSLPLLVPSLALSFAHSVGRSTERERPIPYRPSVIYGCYGRLSLLLYYVFRCACPNVAGEREPHKKGMLKIKKAIPCHIVCYIHLVWSFHANLCAYVWVCECVFFWLCAHSRIDQLCTYYLRLAVCLRFHLG